LENFFKRAVSWEKNEKNGRLNLAAEKRGSVFLPKYRIGKRRSIPFKRITERLFGRGNGGNHQNFIIGFQLVLLRLEEV
jgi:hypothetical protein